MLSRDITLDEEREIRAFMARLAETRVDVGAVPTPEVLWLKARLLRRWAAEQRATVPLDVIEPVQMVAALAATLFLLMWSLPSILGALMP
jgi:hypothetical protein